MTRLDWRHPDLAWAMHADEARPAAHADVLDDLRLDGFAVLARRLGADGREYAVCAKDGWFWLARQIDPDTAGYDGASALVEIVRTDVPWDDDCEIVPESAE